MDDQHTVHKTAFVWGCISANAMAKLPICEGNVNAEWLRPLTMAGDNALISDENITDHTDSNVNWT